MPVLAGSAAQPVSRTDIERRDPLRIEPDPNHRPAHLVTSRLARPWERRSAWPEGRPCAGQVAAEAGVSGGELPRVRRGWVNVPAGGHVSGVFWGGGPPEVVFLHGIGESARAWDAIALTVGRPSVAIDLPGHGRSDWRRDGRYEPGKLASAVAEAIRSFAPRAQLVVGSDLGGRTALALHRRQPRLVPRLVLVSTLSLRREIRYELLHDRDGSWTWRHHPGNLPPAPAGADGADQPGAPCCRAALVPDED